MTNKNIPDEMKEQLEKDNEENGDGLNNVEHDLDMENLDLLYPQLVEKINEFGHEDMLVEFDGSQKQAGDKLQLVQEWFTDENDYRADTNVTPRQVYALTLMRNIDGMFPETDLSETQSWVDQIADDFERYVVSIEGFARKQEENILRAMFGDSGELGANEKDSMFMKMLSNPDSGDDD